MEITERKKLHTQKQIINIIVVLAIAIVFSLIPGFGGITDFGMLVIGAFVGVIYGWATGTPVWTTAVIILYYCQVSGKGFTTEVVAGVFGSPNLWMVIFCYGFILGAQRSGLMAWLSQKIMSLKIAAKGPYWLMAIMFITAFVTTAATQAGNAILVFMFALTGSVAKAMKLKQYSTWTITTGIGVACASVLGGTMLPFNLGIQVVHGVYASMGLAVPNLVVVGMICLASFIVMTAAIILITKFIIRPKINMDMFRSVSLTDPTSQVKFTRAMGLTVAITIIMALVIAIPMVWTTGPVAQILNRFGVVGSFLIACILFCFVPAEDGSPLFELGEALKEASNWMIILNIAAIFYFGGLIGSVDAGLITAFSSLFAPLGSLAPLALALILAFICCMLTQFMNNLVAMYIVLPIGIAFLGDSPAMMAVFLTATQILASIAFCTPSASFQAVLMHADKETFSSKQLMGWGFIWSVIVAAIVIAVTALFCGLF